mmetsp:Transcript_51630/g.95579  ORF Transcript_51630/g.95579 Transcript_51630/m.95579 type:complete len:799 (-) Transcript_51630:54-2450(-)
MDPAEVDVVLGLLQSPDNVIRRQAEAQVEAVALTPVFLTAVLQCTQRSSNAQNRQMAASILGWRLPKAWPSLGDSDRHSVQAALLSCYGTCSEWAVLRLLGEACNALCQTIAIRCNVLWVELIQLVARLLNEEAAIQRRGALDLLAALVQSMGVRLKAHYPELGPVIAARIRDAEPTVRVAALSTAGVLAESWCAAEDDLRQWQVTAEAALEAAAGNANDLTVLQAALRALGHLAPAMRSDPLAAACTDVAVRVLCGAQGAAKAELCQVQAAQLIRALALRSPEFWKKEPRILAGAVAALCTACKDHVPSVDDLDEVSAVALAARDCLRALARASAAQVVPLVYDSARTGSQSNDALDRAAAVHAVVFSLSGAREVPSAWAVPLVRALQDSAVWVRQSAYEGAVLLADALRPAPSTTEGLLLLLAAIAERLASEADIELVQKAASAIEAIFKELATDEAAPSLTKVVPVLVGSLHRVGSEVTDVPASTQSAAVASLASALGAAAAATLDHFEAFAAQASRVLLPLAKAVAARGPHAQRNVFAACVEAAGATVAVAWAQPDVQEARDEFIALSLRILADETCPSEVRASAHGFFARVANVVGDDFAPYLQKVVQPAVSSLAVVDGGEVTVGQRRRVVRTGGEEERVAAIDALGVYSTAVSNGFAVYLPTVCPAVCRQACHASTAVQAASMQAIARLGRALTGLVSGLTNGSADRSAASGMAHGMVQALQGVARDDDGGGGKAVRCALLAIEDLRECVGFDVLVGPAVWAGLLAVVGNRQADDIVSSDEDQDAFVGDDCA